MLVLFDIDDTLLDDSRATNAAVQAFHATLDTRESLESFRQRWMESSNRHIARYLGRELGFQGQRRERIRDALRMDLTDPEADRVFARYLGYYEDNWRVFDDVLPCLNALASLRLGVVSNGDSDQQRRKLNRVGILDHFAVFVGPDDAGVAKPEREIFHRACSLAGVEPGGAVYVGDQHDTDALAAVRAGLRGLWLNRTGVKSDAGEGVTTIYSLSQLPDVLRTWAGQRHGTRRTRRAERRGPTGR